MNKDERIRYRTGKLSKQLREQPGRLHLDEGTATATVAYRLDLDCMKADARDAEIARLWAKGVAGKAERDRIAWIVNCTALPRSTVVDALERQGVRVPKPRTKK